MTDTITIGQQIRKYRKEKGMTQKQLADLLDTTQQNLAQYENGKRIPKLGTLLKLLNALDVPINKITFSATMVDEEAPEFAKPTNNLDFSKKPKCIIETNDDSFLKLADSYHHLNKEGQQKVKEYVDDLSANPKYLKYEDSDNNADLGR